MYDLLCLFPHANASHSLIHYLNQHRRMHVAPFTSIARSLDDVLAYERNLRPFVPTIGVSTKDYDTPDITEKILEATKRDLVIQTVRDPVNSFVSQTNNELFLDKLHKLAGAPSTLLTIEERIADAVTRYITPAAAEIAYQIDSFKEHILIDVEDLKADKAAVTVKSLWRRICGSAEQSDLTSGWFLPIGARQFAQLRRFGSFKAACHDIRVVVHPVIEGDLWTGYYHAQKNVYAGKETILHTVDDARELLPSLRVGGKLHAVVYPQDWYKLHPRIREVIRERVPQLFAEQLRRFDRVFAQAETAMTFTIEALTPVQRELLKLGIEEDFRTFQRRHPDVADRWTESRTFLGV